MGKRRRFSREYKLEAVRMLDGSRGNLAEVSQDLGVSTDSLRRWKREISEVGPTAFSDPSNPSSKEDEIRRLRRELKIAEQERDILKKAIAVFSGRQS